MKSQWHSSRPANMRLHPKRHLNRFSHFCTAHRCAQKTQTLITVVNHFLPLCTQKCEVKILISWTVYARLTSDGQTDRHSDSKVWLHFTVLRYCKCYQTVKCFSKVVCYLQHMLMLLYESLNLIDSGLELSYGLLWGPVVIWWYQQFIFCWILN